MQEFFENLYNERELVRKENSFFTLGDEQLDRGFGLDGNTPTFAVSKKIIEDFAAISYLMGTLGYSVSNFTAVPAGFLASYKNKKNETKTVLVSEGTAEIYQTKLAEEFLKMSRSEGLSDSEREFYLSAKALLLSEKKLEPNAKNSLLHVCLKLNEELEESESLESIKLARENAVDPFVFSSENSVNKKNCDDNQLLIERLCREILGYPLDEKNASESQISEARAMGDKLLHQKILPRYHTFMGNAQLNRDSQIIDREEFLRDLNEDLKSPRRIGVILAICATDFSADLVADLLLKISECEKYDRQKIGIDTFVPPTPGNWWNRNSANELLNSLGVRDYEGMEK